jgi:curli biogenesis system outer membrane secretion channel CsgG
MQPNILFPLLLSALVLSCFAGESVAVCDLSSSGVTKAEAVSLTDALRSELIKSGKYQVMERGQMEQILKEQGFQQSGACSEAS